MTSNEPNLIPEPTHNSGLPSGLRQRKNANNQQSASNSQMAKASTTPKGNNSQQQRRPGSPGIEKSPYVESLVGGAMRPSAYSAAHHRAITTIDRHFRYLTMGTICTYILLVSLCYMVVPTENIIKLDGIERNSAIMAGSLIGISFLSRVVPIIGWSFSTNVVQGRKKGESKTQSTEKLSGIIIGGLTVQMISLMTDVLLAYFPTPLLIDPVLGTRVHVLRWCGWCPCAAFMTFMVEGADIYWTGDHPPRDYLKRKYIHGATQGGAVFLGLLFPFCPGFTSWMVCMVVACCLYLTNYPRLWNRRREIPRTLPKGATVEEAERFNSAKISLRLRYVTTAVWSVIVALYFVSSVFGPKFSPEGSIWHSPAANMACECFFDVMSKVLFLVIIVDVHNAIFDANARTERRLEELRQLMAAVWESSSDVIAISVKTGPNGGVSTMLSPAFFSLGSGDGPLRNLSKEQVKDLFQRKSILYHLSDGAFQANRSSADGEEQESNDPKVRPEMISNIEETGFTTLTTQGGKLLFDGDGVNSETGALRAVSDVVVKSWDCGKGETLFSHDLQWSSRHDKNHLVRTEAKVSRLDENALILIVRDISERVRVFEAEKQILFETTSRQKDAEANRFTRHEVKNGLLSAIGLYESLCDAQKEQLTNSQFKDTTTGGVGFDADISDDVVRCMNELGKSLHETLDTILIEAMTRDLIHDLYRPHRERINIASVLSGVDDKYSHSGFDIGGVRNLTRFPLITRPSPLPILYFDPSLLRYLHREALSNACKYGKTGSSVLTEIIYDEKRQRLQINVINLPGELHNKLIEMGTEAEEMVFSKSSQVHEMIQGDAASRGSTKKSEAAALPGDGGWIIQKCAKIMKGECSIKFEESRTVFSLSVPAKLIERKKAQTPTDVKAFSLPDGTWGIAIDDSKIQMKLLAKYFEFAGLPKERIKVFGKDAEEIMGFVDYVVSFMDENMGDHVLLIADENLDINDEAAKHITISGSQLVENIRARLLPEQEKKLVAFIRSANDSSSDVAIYNSRAHGFIPKAPIKKGNVLECLAPLWIARYPQRLDEDDSMSQTSRNSRADSFSSESLESITSLNDFIVTSPTEIIQTVKEIDLLFSQGPIIANWDIIGDKLHALKGDILTLSVGSKVISSVGMINSIRELHDEDLMKERWGLFKDHISHWLNPPS